MLNLSESPTDHEGLFLARYPRLISWSAQMSSHDRQRAEDIVHDAFIQWMIARPDLTLIRNLDGYLYGMLRNMHAAEFRRSLRNPTGSLSVIEYDLAFVSLQRAADQLHSARMQEQLRRVCDYACARKETSKAGSIFLIRFFRGYYPEETARIAGLRRVTVDSWLRVARSEAKLYLEKPDASKFIRQNEKHEKPQNSDNGNSEFIDEIFDRISRSCQGSCLSVRKLRNVYSGHNPEPLNCENLAHVATCQRCLEKAASCLKLSPKSDRYATDCLGRDPKPGHKRLAFGNRRKSNGAGEFSRPLDWPAPAQVLMANKAS